MLLFAPFVKKLNFKVEFIGFFLAFLGLWHYICAERYAEDGKQRRSKTISGAVSPKDGDFQYRL